MEENIKILYIKEREYWIGIDLYEIKKVIHKSMNKAKVNEFLKRNKVHNTNFYTMKSFFNEEEDLFNFLIIIESLPNHQEIVLAVSGGVDIVEVPLSDILIIPEFIRKRQKNPYTWGIIKGKQKPVVLFTFSCLSIRE